MTQLLEQFRLWIEQLILATGYIGIAVVMFIENIFPPIPSEVIMPFAGSLAARGELNFVGVMVAGTVGALLGAVAIYYVGLWLGEEVMRRWLRQYGRYLLMSTEDFDQAVATFNKHGEKMVLFGRLLPGIRSLISLPAGMERMSLHTFLLFTIIGTTLWNLLLAYAGLILGRNWQRVLEFLNTYEQAVWIVLAGLLLLFLTKRLYQLSKKEVYDS